MGYQESFVQFKNKETLVSELKKYKIRNFDEDLARVYGVNKVKKSIKPFREGELVLVVGGERSEQRNEKRLVDGLGINNVKNIVFIDNPAYWEMSNGEIGKLLDEHFEQLSEKEHDELLK
ncbi:hypothetical protein D3C84_483160 [compost metagenome]